MTILRGRGKGSGGYAGVTALFINTDPGTSSPQSTNRVRTRFCHGPRDLLVHPTLHMAMGTRASDDQEQQEYGVTKCDSTKPQWGQVASCGEALINVLTSGHHDDGRNDELYHCRLHTVPAIWGRQGINKMGLYLISAEPNVIDTRP